MLLQRPGVAAVNANPVAQTATVSFDPSVTSVEQISGWIRDCGYHCRDRLPLQLPEPACLRRPADHRTRRPGRQPRAGRDHRGKASRHGPVLANPAADLLRNVRHRQNGRTRLPLRAPVHPSRGHRRQDRTRLQLSGKEVKVSVHPIVFHHALDQAALAGWQVIQEPDWLRVLLAGLAPGGSVEAVRAAVSGALTPAGVVQTRVDVQLVEHLERTALGKAPFVRRLAPPN